MENGILPLFLSDLIPENDPVFAFDRLMEEVNVAQYLPRLYRCQVGRRRYNPVRMLKTILFGYLYFGSISLRRLELLCQVDIRFRYLMDGAEPVFSTFQNFINDVLCDKIEDIFAVITKKIFEIDCVDLQHLYIDGSKFEASSNKYTWVWKKGVEKSRANLFLKISKLIAEVNKMLPFNPIYVCGEYAPETVKVMMDHLKEAWNLDETKFVHGVGHRKTPEQRYYEEFQKCYERLKDYAEKINTCGPDRNSYSKTDPDATFMRTKKDHTGNDQLLPAYNIQFGVADEYIAVASVEQYRSDMDCFVPLIEKFHATYGFYPEYPVADAGYGSFNNYLYCEKVGMKRYMKFPMWKKETKDKKYHENPFRPVNYRIENEVLYCPNNKPFHFKKRQPIRGNKYGREEELYECEDCSGCPLAEKCKKGKNNKVITLNRELTTFHEEVMDNLASPAGILLRINRSIQSEGTFGVIKQDRHFRRITRRGMKNVKLEILLVALGFNLNKYCTKQRRKEQRNQARA